MNEAFHDIPNSDTWDTVQRINKGWSEDEKYYIKTKQGDQLLLRISEISDDEKEKSAYDAMRQFDDFDILTSRLLDAGFCNDRKNIYRLFTWIEGKEAEQILPQLSSREQYHLGVKAGMALQQIHQIACPVNQGSWADRFNKKIDRNIRRYESCRLKFPHADQVIHYIEERRNLLENRPQCFQHGDYHVGNMIITENGALGIIDFNRLDFGDPWEEFNRIIFCASASPWFASGQINGYFEEGVPGHFFELMALYIGSNLLAAGSWAIHYGQREIETMFTMAKDILAWYDNFQADIPSWYRSKLIDK